MSSDSCLHNSKIWMEVFLSSSSYPDLVSNDYHLFLYVKTWFGCQQFKETEELNTSVLTEISGYGILCGPFGTFLMHSKASECFEQGSDYLQK